MTHIHDDDDDDDDVIEAVQTLPAASMTSPSSGGLDAMSADLAKSGLVLADVSTRLMDDNVRSAIGLMQQLPGYVFPYFDIRGRILPFYRVKLLKQPKGAEGLKYMQPKSSPNHVYFPKSFWHVWSSVGFRFCLLTEGEKKAAACVKAGIPCVAFGGKDSWQNRMITVPKNAQISSLGGAIGIKLPSANLDERDLSTLATGFQELIDIGLKHNTTFFIVYDTDNSLGVSTDVQRSAAKLGFELRFKGFTIPQIRQIILPHDLDANWNPKLVIPNSHNRLNYEEAISTPLFGPGGKPNTAGAEANFSIVLDSKVGLDDLLVHKNGGPSKLITMIESNFKTRSTFPTHPAIREYIGKKLQKARIDRKQMGNISLALLTELDAHGTRMFAPDDLQAYYFNSRNKHLIKVDINKPNLSGQHEGEFGRLLYREYGISLAADNQMIRWLGAQYTGEDPLEIVYPYRIFARPKPNEDIVRYQINNGQYIKVSGDENQPYKIMPNGAEGILFESMGDNAGGPNDEMELDEKRLGKELQKRHREPLKMWWKTVIDEVRLKYPGKTGTIIALLYYLSPWLMRWRGLQLPVELIIGEPGSGKSTLCEIRLNIISGDPKLRNTPKDIAGWHASIANSGGLIVTDNVHMTDKNLNQQISDELCRVVTEPDPRINMRKFFTEADERSIRVGACFAFTAIKHPFQNSDLIQRSVVLELSKSSEKEELGPASLMVIPKVSIGEQVPVTYDSQWKDLQIKRFGGRHAWVSHHLHVVHEFFKKVEEVWDPDYKARNRLVNLEQALIVMAEVFGIEDAREWIPQYIVDTTNSALQNSDWTLEGLCEYANYIRRTPGGLTRQFGTSDIATWAQSQEDWEKCYTLANSRSLGKYMQNNLHAIQDIAHIVPSGSKNNKIVYSVRKPK